MSDPMSSIDALQASLQGEYAAVFGYGQAAGALGGADLTQARRYLDAHRQRRDRLRALVLDAGTTPVSAAPVYAVPPTPNAPAARDVLSGIEARLGATYADLVSASTGSTRDLAVTALVDSTVRAARWGADVPAFPGLTERAPAPSTTPPATPTPS